MVKFKTRKAIMRCLGSSLEIEEGASLQEETGLGGAIPTQVYTVRGVIPEELVLATQDNSEEHLTDLCLEMDKDPHLNRNHLFREINPHFKNLLEGRLDMLEKSIQSQEKTSQSILEILKNGKDLKYVEEEVFDLGFMSEAE